MHKTYRNVNEAFVDLIEETRSRECFGVESSRNGEVIRVDDGPVIVTYLRPTERVLFNEVRDCNPFFHLYESLWMLAGKNTVSNLIKYTPRMSTYSDDGVTLHGAYGYRWRNYFGYDQLDLVIEELKTNPDSRRAVVQMWDANDLKTARGGGLDVPCNTQMVFAIGKEGLNMTVFNRSNDLIWGMLGANVVHFSYVQEYVANALDVEVGVYNQVSNNLHIYKEIWDKYQSLDAEDLSLTDEQNLVMEEPSPKLFEGVKRLEFDKEVKKLVNNEEAHCNNEFLRTVASPMLLAWRHHKERDYSKAIEAVDRVQDKSWSYVGRRWLERRRDNYLAKGK